MTKKHIGVYHIVNTACGKRYIGSSSDLVRRLYEHRRALRAGTHRNAHLLSAWKACGESVFRFEVLHYTVDAAEALRVEKTLILSCRTHDPVNGYNISIEPSNNQLGLKRSPETRAKIGAAKRGNKNRLGKGFTDEARARIAAGVRGLVKSEATRQKLSASLKGLPKSAEWCRKMSELMRGRSISVEQRAAISATLRGRKVPADVIARRLVTLAAKKAATSHGASK